MLHAHKPDIDQRAHSRAVRGRLQPWESRAPFGRPARAVPENMLLILQHLSGTIRAGQGRPHALLARHMGAHGCSACGPYEQPDKRESSFSPWKRPMPCTACPPVYGPRNTSKRPWSLGGPPAAAILAHGVATGPGLPGPAARPTPGRANTTTPPGGPIPGPWPCGPRALRARVAGACPCIPKWPT